MKYDVNVYHTVRTKVTGIEASSQEEAMKKADELFTDAGYETESAEEVTGYLVDEQGDEQYRNSRSYDAEYRPDAQDEQVARVLETMKRREPDPGMMIYGVAFDKLVQADAQVVAEWMAWFMVHGTERKA